MAISRSGRRGRMDQANPDPRPMYARHCPHLWHRTSLRTGVARRHTLRQRCSFRNEINDNAGIGVASNALAMLGLVCQKQRGRVVTLRRYVGQEVAYHVVPTRPGADRCCRCANDRGLANISVCKKVILGCCTDTLLEHVDISQAEHAQRLL